MTRFQNGRELRRRAMTRQRGFTLLEVMVALTITGMVLGSLFTLAAGSKRLAFLSGESLGVATAKRAAVNFALLQNDYRDVEAILESSRFDIRAGEELEPPLRKTQALTFGLQTYEVVDEETDETVTGTRWIERDVAQ